MPVAFNFASSNQKIQAVIFFIDNVQVATILSKNGGQADPSHAQVEAMPKLYLEVVAETS